MNNPPAFFNPIFTDIFVPCGICHELIKPNSVAHGHYWAPRESDCIVFDLFHRTCIQDKLTSGPPNCPQCKCRVVNAADYDEFSDPSQARLLFQENRTVFLTLVKERKSPSLKEFLDTVKTIPDSIQLEALEFAVQQNDSKIAKKILFIPKPGIQPTSLLLLLNTAAYSGFDSIIKVFLDYNASYLRRTDITCFKAFHANDIYSAARIAITNSHFSAANLLLNAPYSFAPAEWESLFYLSVHRGYWEGMQMGLESGIAGKPGALENGLLLAARRGNWGMILALLNQRSAQPLDLGPPLLSAIAQDYPKLALVLLEHARLLDHTVRSKAAQSAAAKGFEELLTALVLNGPISKEARYWGQVASKTQACLDILSSAEVY